MMLLTFFLTVFFVRDEKKKQILEWVWVPNASPVYSPPVSPGPTKSSDEIDMFHYMQAFDFLWPAYKSSEIIVEHEGFTLSYNERYEHPRWIAYRLDLDRLRNSLMVSKGMYRADPLVRTGSAYPEDYEKILYVKGHMVPPEDLKWSHTAHSASYYMSTICPQDSVFQQELWWNLEKGIRGWTELYEKIYIVSGAHGGHRINSKIVVPNYFYKILLVVHEKKLHGIAFWFPHPRKKYKAWRKYAYPIDRVEAWTGLNFFPTLPKEVAREVEGSYDEKLWP
ncbi:MAG: DNA/RNA non-specific endonuclease [Cytophagales bacterium]|nr:DNA/RNA non-specific endonuclease [Cytophagales bacterium]